MEAAYKSRYPTTTLHDPTLHPKDGGSMVVRNVGTLQHHYMTSHFTLKMKKSMVRNVGILPRHYTRHTSPLKIESVWPSETSVSYRNTTRRRTSPWRWRQRGSPKRQYTASQRRRPRLEYPEIIHFHSQLFYRTTCWDLVFLSHGWYRTFPSHNLSFTVRFVMMHPSFICSDD
jgi:hypothetical protein